MKYLLLFLALTGCTVLPQPFDNILYDKYVNASVQLSNTNCSYPSSVITDVQGVITSLDEALVYEKYHGGETNLIQATEIVKTDLDQMITSYTGNAPPPTEMYCKLKLQIQQASLLEIVKAVGGKHNDYSQ